MKKMKISNIILAYHHIVVIYSLLLDSLYFQAFTLFFTELSNIPSYFVYHGIKKGYKDLTFWKTLQKELYGPIRVPALTTAAYFKTIYYAS